MKTLLVCSLLLCACIFPQSWHRIETIPESMTNFIYNDGDTLYTADDSLIYISRDEGMSWSVLSDQSPSKTESVIKFNNIIYAGSYGSGVFRSSDGGSSWEAFNTGLSSWAKYVVQFYIMNNKLYLASDGGGIFYLDLTNPVSWIEYNENLPSKVAWTVICMTGSNNNLIISSGANGFVHVRPEGSTGWSGYYLDSLRTPQAWSLLSYGDYVFAGTIRTIYRSYDNGIHWDSVGISAIRLRSTVLRSFEGIIYAGITRPGEFWIWTSADSGMTWQFADHQFFDLSDLYVTRNHIFAATAAGLYKYEQQPVSVPLINHSSLTENLSVYPNPFNPITIIKAVVPEDGFIQLNIFNIMGEKVFEIFNGENRSGVYEYPFNGGYLSGGIYICTLQANGKQYSKKIIMLK